MLFLRTVHISLCRRSALSCSIIRLKYALPKLTNTVARSDVVLFELPFEQKQREITCSGVKDTEWLLVKLYKARLCFAFTSRLIHKPSYFSDFLLAVPAN
jgi:hypothetical protein